MRVLLRELGNRWCESSDKDCERCRVIRRLRLIKETLINGRIFEESGLSSMVWNASMIMGLITILTTSGSIGIE